MPTKLSTTVSKIQTIPNAIKCIYYRGTPQIYEDNDSSERHQNNALKVVINLYSHLRRNTRNFNYRHFSGKSFG
jgi:hypothetical protein